MKKLKKQERFSKILELEKVDISILTGNESSRIKGGLTVPPTRDLQLCVSNQPTNCYTDCNCTYTCGGCGSTVCNQTAGCLPTDGCNPTNETGYPSSPGATC